MPKYTIVSGYTQMGKIRAYIDELDEGLKHHFRTRNIIIGTVIACVVVVAIEIAML